jgi:serine/threonine protein kinase
MDKIINSRWVVIKELGEGGQGRTYLVKDLDSTSDKKFVLKMLKTPKGIERLKKEIKAINILNHNKILKIKDYCLNDDYQYMVSEYCEGGNLEESEPFWRIDPITTIEFFLIICNALNYAHKNSIIHRDIKPKNIFLQSKHGPPVIGDFGICFIEDDGSRVTLTDEAVGAMKFISPEMEDGRGEVTTKTDVYSMGKLLYWLFSEKGVFAREKHREENWDIRGRTNDNFIGWKNLYLEHINRILDVMIIADPQKRKEIDEIIPLLEMAKYFIRKEYNPIGKNLPQPCTYCGQGLLREQPNDLYGVRNFGITPISGSDWTIMVCDNCGNVKLFRNDLIKKKK